MIRQRLFKATVAVGLLCGFVQAAHAAGLTSPISDWTIGPILAQTDNGKSYCSMKNSYPGGEKIVFARDSRGSNSIALDLSQDTLDVGRQYNLNLKVGVVTRSAIALGATKQVMVMQMGADNVFYNALKRKKNLSFNNMDTSKGYGFHLDASVADALNALDDCAKSLISGDKFAQVTIPLGKAETVDLSAQAEEEAQPVAAKRQVSNKKSNKKTAAKKLRSENEKLALENQQIQQQLLAREKGMNIEEELELLRAENKRLAIENQEIKGQMLASGANPAPQNIMPRSTEIAPEVPSMPVPVVNIQPLPRSPANLQAIGVVPQGALRSGDAYRWTSDDIYGAAQELPWQPGSSFDEMAQSYIAQASSVCHGQFAHKLGTVRKAGRLNVLEAEMTCLDGENNAAAAVLFVQDQGSFGVITQEGTIEQLTVAMFKRDTILARASDTEIN